MIKTFITSFILCIFVFIGQSQTIYVDSNFGDDNNPGTIDAPLLSIEKAAGLLQMPDNDIYKIKINPGIYILDHHILVSTKKEPSEKRIEIEATVLPDDSVWTHEQMPVIISKARKGEIQESDHFVAAFLVNDSHVTIRGIKFSGYAYPNTKYFPIARFNKGISDLLVEQCVFAGEEQASKIQVGIIAHGNEVKVNHCIFYNVRNAVVFWEDSGNGIKNGNSMTNCIVHSVSEGAVWTCSADKDFLFENNIVTKSKYVWIINTDNPTRYSMQNSVIVNNEIYKANWEKKTDDFELDEINILKEGEITLRYLSSMDEALPIDYLHIVPESVGHSIGAGLFMNRKE